MSAFLAVAVQAIVATPTPSPEIIKETLQPIVQPVAQTPEVVLQLAELAGLAVAAFVVSSFHQIVEWVTTKGKDIPGWTGNLNRGLATLYATGLGLLEAFRTGNLKADVTGAATAAVSIAVALAATFWGYELRNFFTSMMGFVKVGGTKPEPSPEALPAE